MPPLGTVVQYVLVGEPPSQWTTINLLLLHVPLGMDVRQQGVVEGLTRIWSRDGGDWKVLLESIGSKNGYYLSASATSWQTVSSYLHPWHIKKKLGIEADTSVVLRARIAGTC